MVLSFTMKKICIVKLGAIGDVVRTTPIVEAIKKKYLESEITWITKESSREVLEGNLMIDKILVLPVGEDLGEFDILYSCDIEKAATEIAEKINANEKFGYYSDGGYAAPYNFEAEYYLNTVFDDELKRENKKTYQEMIFDAMGFKFNCEKIVVNIPDEVKKWANDFLIDSGINGKKILGVNLGSSPRWPSKAWHLDYLEEFIIKMNNKGYKILLLWGPEEEEKVNEIYDRLKEKGVEVYKTDTRDSLKKFFALVECCDNVLSADSMALHVALGLGKKITALFFVTSPDELEGYSLLKKIVSPMLYDFFPHKSDLYNEELVRSITVEEVVKSFNNDGVDLVGAREVGVGGSGNTKVEKMMGAKGIGIGGSGGEKSVKVVNAIIKNKDDKFLVIKRNGGIHGGKWALVGGIVENNESSDEALMREVKEEVGLNVLSIGKKVGNYQYYRPSGEITLGESYLVDYDGLVSINEEVEEYRWVSLEEFEKMDFVEGIDFELMECL